MTPLLPVALTAADLPLAELGCARLDGEVYALAGSWCPVDTFDGPGSRAAAIAPQAPARAVAERMTAAWIYGLAPEPGRHQFCVDVDARTRKPDGSDVHLREVRLSPAETLVIGEVAVTTPLRTAIDLARWGCPGGVPAGPALLADLLACGGVAAFDLLGTLLAAERPGQLRGISFGRVAADQLEDALRLVRGTTSRLRRLAVADPVDVVDGVDPAHGVEHPVEVRGVAHFEHEPADGQSVA